MKSDHNPLNELSRDAFAAAAERYRSGLKLHCYRMLGSLHEAEDAVQETFLNAWSSIRSFEQRASLKNWLYRIATNACLNILARHARRRRVLPEMLYGPTTEFSGGEPDMDTRWIDPYPTQAFEGTIDRAHNPESRYELKESVRLAFVAAIQFLPPRQRAALILSDVLGWAPDDVASLLGGTTASINSVLQRGRATMRQRYNVPQHKYGIAPHAERERELLKRYVQAWESRDLDGFASILAEDATYAMPPRRQWFAGSQSIRAFFEGIWPVYNGFRLKPTSANGQPAFGLYCLDPNTQLWRAHSLQVLTLSDRGVLALVSFMAPLGPSLFADFELPSSL